MPKWANKKTTKDIISTVLAWTFVVLIVLTVILTAAVRRTADPVYPTRWNEFSNEIIRFDYPQNFRHIDTSKQDIIDDVKQETYLFRLIDGSSTIAVTVIYNIDAGFIAQTPFADNPRNTVFKHEESKLPLGYGFQYDNDRLEGKYLIILGVFLDENGADNMRRIVEHMGQSMRNPRVNR